MSSLSEHDISEIKNAFKRANYLWIFLSLFLGLLSHISRSYRWNFLLEPLGYKSRLLNNVFAVFSAYLINLALPRAGEFARATAISKYEDIPFEKAFGTIVAERVIDVIMLLIVIVFALFYQFDLLRDVLLTKIPDNPAIHMALVLLLAILGWVFFAFLKKSDNRIAKKLRGFLIGLFKGVKSIFEMKKKWAFLAHTLFIWAMYILMFYTVLLALPETSQVGFGAVITGFVIGSLSIAATNAGLGTYPLGVQQVLILYGVASNPALAFGWLMWTAQTLMVLFFGGLSMLLLPVYNRDKNL